MLDFISCYNELISEAGSGDVFDDLRDLVVGVREERGFSLVEASVHLGCERQWLWHLEENFRRVGLDDFDFVLSGFGVEFMILGLGGDELVAMRRPETLVSGFLSLVRQFMIIRGISQVELAELLGVKQPSISFLLKGKRILWFDSVKKLEDALDFKFVVVRLS